jgi:hypothetical protein
LNIPVNSKKNRNKPLVLIVGGGDKSEVGIDNE